MKEKKVIKQNKERTNQPNKLTRLNQIWKNANKHKKIWVTKGTKVNKISREIIIENRKLKEVDWCFRSNVKIYNIETKLQ